LRHAPLLASGFLLVAAGCVDLTRPSLDPDGGVDLATRPEVASEARATDAPTDGPGVGDAADAPAADAPGAPEAGADRQPDMLDAGQDLPSTLGMGLVAYWTMDDDPSNKIFDQTANHNDLLVEGLPVSFTNPLPTLAFPNPAAVAFRGIDAAAWAPDADSLAPARITFATWVRFEALPSRSKCGGAATNLQYLMFRRNPAAANGITDAVALIKQGDDRLAFVLQDGNGVRDVAVSTTVVQVGRWYHLAGTFDGNQMRLYVNGTGEGMGTHTSALVYDRSGRFWLARSGECKDMGLGVSNFDGELAGVLDDVRVYNRALGASEARDLWLGKD